MSQEALSMAKLLIACVTRGDINGQYHWANLIMLDALANGAKGPEVASRDTKFNLNTALSFALAITEPRTSHAKPTSFGDALIERRDPTEEQPR